MGTANRTAHPGLFTGTSGWSYKHWKDVFYPAEVRPSGYLEYYLTKFSCVELNASFYHLPKESTVEGWVRRTPDNFRFCPKLSRFITHQKRLAGCEEALDRFMELFEGMKNRLGPLLIQLPPGMTFDGPLIMDFLDLLGKYSGRHRFALEVRHPSWITDSFFELLRQHQVAFVIADSGGRFPFHEAVTSDFVYLRFHGPENLYASDYDESTLQWYAEKIAEWLRSDLEVWVFFNNDYHGYAVKNALRINELVQSQS